MHGNYLISCKCPGTAGTAHVTFDYVTDRDASDFGQFVWGHCERCTQCGRRFIFKAIQGKHSDKHTCGAKCLASKGPDCQCSCAGKNHGKGWA